jgi:MinD-like ATPase involved in chromosome partitioning or flagellar assembly
MAIAPEGKRVAYVDGDMHKGDILKRLQMPDNVPTINDLQDVGAVTADAVHRVIVTLKDYHLDVVLAPPTHPGSRGMPLQAVRLYTRVVQRLLEEYDYVVIDTPQAASRGEGESPIFRNFVNVVADMQIVILEPDVSTVDDIRHHLMRTTNPRFAPSPDEVISADRFGYVLNKARPGINMTVEDVRQMMGAMWAYLGEIPAVFDAIQAAANQGELLTTDPEFTRALRTILWKATAEPALRPDVGQQSEAAGRRLSRLRRRR